MKTSKTPLTLAVSTVKCTHYRVESAAKFSLHVEVMDRGDGGVAWVANLSHTAKGRTKAARIEESIRAVFNADGSRTTDRGWMYWGSGWGAEKMAVLEAVTLEG